MNKINSNEERILITGVSGLIGRILFNHLTKTYPNKYQVFGLDRQTKISPRYDTVENYPTEYIFEIPSDKFYQCDITDREKLFEIIQKLRIDIIIHLAAVLESDPDIDKILNVNINGTKNVLEAPGVHRIICASSIMTVFGYITREPYQSIANDTFNDETMLKDLRKLTVKDDPPLADLRTPSNKAYTESKIAGEQMAMDIIEKDKSKSIICVRFGWVSLDDQPGNSWHRTVWWSYRDLCSFIEKALEAPQHISGIYFTTSNNHRIWYDLKQTEKDLGFIPQDGAKKLNN